MDIRKIAAAAGLACSAALVLSPLASADVDASALLDSEIAQQNSLFEVYAALGGVTDVVKGGPGVYDQLGNVAVDAPQATTYGDVTQLETSLYGANPILAGISGNSGPYNEFNGALTQLYDAYNVYANAAANGGALDTDVNDYLGSTTTIGHALDTGSVSGAAQYFLNFAMGDLKGYDAIFAPPVTGPDDLINSVIGNETVQLNNLFELDGKLAGVFGDIAPHGSADFGVGFDTIDPTKLNDTFTQLVFGFNPDNVSPDPGSYDIFNGALSEFFNASNVGLFALLNGGDLLPSSDIIGTALTGDVSTVIGEYLQAGFADLAGYFDIGSLMG